LLARFRQNRATDGKSSGGYQKLRRDVAFARTDGPLAATYLHLQRQEEGDRDMKRKCLVLAGAAAMVVAGVLSLSGSAEAACGHGYKPMKHRSGNTVCVLDAAAGNGKLKAR
jgi:hypothetical protein